MKVYLLFLILGVSSSFFSQTTVDIYLDSVTTNVGAKYQPGVFYVPKTTEAQNDFLNNGIRQNSIRINIIEGALNNTSNLNDCIAYLDGVSTIIQELSSKTDKLLFIFEKMPAWLSSSSDGSPASTPGWYVLNTKPPANYSDWDNMVSSIVDRIINTYGINNAYFEVWNEPDLGSWTGTADEYFELFEHTYDAIKSVDATIPVGGPATNHWAKNINYEPPYGYLSNQIGDSSLIGQLIDSTVVWNKPLDFISWHNFNLVHQTNQNAIDYLNYKCNALGIQIPELIVSEWNTPSVVRDTPLQKSFFIKSQIEMAKTSVDNNMIAAWQDFNQSTNEFHNDYGLVTYGGIHKPAYKALLLSNKMKGTRISNTTSELADIVTTISNDTLNILLVNYAPFPFIEAFNHTLFEGHFNANQIDSAGFIDISTNDLSHLDSIYQGLVSIPSTNPMNTAINNSIPIYNHFNNSLAGDRAFNLNVLNITGTHSGVNYTIDSTTNNFQYKYDSLLANGFTQSNAITNITGDQTMNYSSASLVNGQISVLMEPNSVQLFQFVIPEILNLDKAPSEVSIMVYPNPTDQTISIESKEIIGEINVYNAQGRLIYSTQDNKKQSKIELAKFPSGVYYVRLVGLNETFKVIRK